MTRAVDVVYLCDWLPPDFGAVGQYALIRARGFAAEGRHVALYGLSSTDSGTECEPVAGGSLRIVRLHAKRYDKTRMRWRLWWTAVTNARLLVHSLRDLRACRQVVFTGSPPLMLHFIAPLNLLLRRRLTYRITDFFPEAIIAALDRPSRALRLLHGLTRFWRRRIHAFEVLGEDQRALLLAQGISADRIRLVRDPNPVPIERGTEPLPLPHLLRGKVVLLYSGNFGVAHDYETLLEAYASHHRDGRGKVVLWLNATGTGADALEKQLLARGLPVLRTQPVPLEQLARLLVTPHAHLITLKDRFAGIVLPSKVFGCIESGRDIVYVGPVCSDVHALCEERRGPGRYHRVGVGDTTALTAVLEDLAARWHEAAAA